MTDPADNSDVEDRAEASPVLPEPGAEPLQPQKRGRSKLFYILIGVVSTVAIISLLCVGLVVTGGLFAWQVSGEVQAVLTTYMEALESQDVDAAYAMMSVTGQQAASRAEFDEFVTGYGRDYMRGFKTLTVQSINRSFQANTNPDALQGEIVTVQALLEYENGSEGVLNATLQKIGNRWMIAGANIQKTATPNTPEAQNNTIVS